MGLIGSLSVENPDLAHARCKEHGYEKFAIVVCAVTYLFSSSTGVACLKNDMVES